MKSWPLARNFTIGSMSESGSENQLLKPGEQLLGKFRIERVIGQGGAGVVYAAHHELLDQRIALKVLLAGRGSEAAARFVNEGRLAAKIRSEHVCRVMDVGLLFDGSPYIAMEYLEGRDLETVVSEGPTEVAVAVDYILQAMDAVAQAHAHGIVHRDLKPANLFLTKDPDRDDPVVKVLDFGISKAALGGDKDMTTSRAILGSPSYMSPEQIKNARNVDPRTDIWSLGVILYELVTGRPPFDGETVGEVFAKILEAAPPPFRTYVPDVPEEFERVVLRCLERERDARFPNVAELATALAPYAGMTGAGLVSRIERAIARGDGPPSERAVKSEAVGRKIGSTTTVAGTTTVGVTKRGRKRLVAAVAVIAAGGAVYGGGPLIFPSLGRGGSSVDRRDGSAETPARPFEGIFDAIATAISSLASDASALDAAQDAGNDGAAVKDAGKKPAGKPPPTKGKQLKR